MIGLAVMGSNLARNLESKNYAVAVYNLEPEMTDAFLKQEVGRNFTASYSLKDLVASLQKPRIVFMMIRAGHPVDMVIEELLPLLDKGDIIIDGGNSNFDDTVRRTEYVESKGMLFVGCGVSGGETGALNGPSLMVGGSPDAWKRIKPVLTSIAAKVDDGTPCCDYVGEDGAGHFVKMVHNGIEYGDMELICEAYHLMRDLADMTDDEMQEVFRAWNRTELDSYLIEITGKILGVKEKDGVPLVERILDDAGQKGTGKWAAAAALNEGVPLTLISESVFQRCLSSMKDERIHANAVYNRTIPAFSGDKKHFIEEIRKALYASKIISYAQGYTLMREAARSHNWNLNYGGIALIWRGGCIIRSAFLGKIKEAFDRNPELSNILLDPFFKETFEQMLPSWRNVVSTAVTCGIPVPAFASALSYFDSYTTERLPANLLQAQRDYFGAHTYERIDRERGQLFHTNWDGEGGNISSTSYNV